MEKVSVTTLKANLAHYLSKLKAGRSFLVTDRGQAVAVLEPLAWTLQVDEAMNQLVRTGQVTPPSQELPEDFFTKPRFKAPEGLLQRFLSEDRKGGR
jgi:antitoxin (DNA-binding transcriptional repressor) of toxin-antitoxin stability system